MSMKGLSKFDYDWYYGDLHCLAVSKQRYTKEQAIDIARREFKYEYGAPCEVVVLDGFVRHQAGITEDGDPFVGWWLMFEDGARRCPVWVFETKARCHEVMAETKPYEIAFKLDKNETETKREDKANAANDIR